MILFVKHIEHRPGKIIFILFATVTPLNHLHFGFTVTCLFAIHSSPTVLCPLCLTTLLDKL